MGGGAINTHLCLLSVNVHSEKIASAKPHAEKKKKKKEDICTMVFFTKRVKILPLFTQIFPVVL